MFVRITLLLYTVIQELFNYRRCQREGRETATEADTETTEEPEDTDSATEPE